MGIETAYTRNLGFWSKDEQDAIGNTRVAIAGAGGDGYQLGLNLAMMGVRDFSLADPEVFEIENSNRVIGATGPNIGRNKALALAAAIHEMRPDATVRTFTDGVTNENAEAFMQGATLVIDESELTTPYVGTMIAREARRCEVPTLMVMNIGFAAVATSIKPTGKHSFERMMGISDNAPIDEVKDMELDFSRCLPYIPGYGDVDTLKSVLNGSPLPSIVQGVNLATALGTTEFLKHATYKGGNHRSAPTWNPKWMYMDAYNGRSGKTRARLGYAAGVAGLLARSTLKMNPKTSYSNQ